MQFLMLMIPKIYRGNKADPGFLPDPKKLAEMGRFNDELGKAVTILSLNGLHPLNTGARVSFGKGKPTVTDGPFIETTEVLGGFWMVEASSKEELVKWAQRCPADEGDVKYHQGAFGNKTTRSGKEIKIQLSSNPSHLEFVDPVVEGMARARQFPRKRQH